MFWLCNRGVCGLGQVMLSHIRLAQLEKDRLISNTAPTWAVGAYSKPRCLKHVRPKVAHLVNRARPGFLANYLFG